MKERRLTKVDDAWSGGARNFNLGDCSSGGLENGSSQWAQGRSPGRGSGDEISHKLKQFADIVYRFRLQK